MTIALLTALALTALLAYREWGFARERREVSDRLARSAAETAAERDRAATERRELYQRIQAPEIAVHEVALEARRERPYVRRQPIGADNDKAFAASKEGEA